jgi:biotin operon repressor
MAIVVRSRLTQVMDCLTSEDTHVKAPKIARKLRMSRSSVYRTLKLIRRSGVGVHRTKKGYILSRIASKQDDISFLNYMSGRRQGDFYALSASKKDIIKRWPTLKEQHELQMMLAPMLPNQKLLENSSKVIISYVNKMGL